MDMRALKVGQKVRVQFYSQVKDATVEAVTEDYIWVDIPRSETENGYCIELNHDGSYRRMCSAGGAWEPRPVPGLKIIGIKEEATQELVAPQKTRPNLCD
jgi:hypothetical protein